MAREGTKAHALSVASGETPMATGAAIACIAHAVRAVGAGAASPPAASPPAASAALSSASPLAASGPSSPAPAPHPEQAEPNLQFCIADVSWWRSPWPDHPLVQGVVRRSPAAVPSAAVVASGGAAAEEGGAEAGGVLAPELDAEAKAANGRARAEAWMRGRLNEWELETRLAELGLDSLDLVQLRNAFNKHFRTEVPLSVFSNANQTLAALLGRVGELI